MPSNNTAMHSLSEWRLNQTRSLLLLVSLLIAAILPGLHFMLKIIPGLPADPLGIRLIAAGTILLFGTLTYLLKPLHRFSEAVLFFNVTLLLCVDILLITHAQNNLIHISAGLLAIFGAQVLFTRFWYCLSSYALALVFQIAYTASVTDIRDFRNLTTIFIYGNAYAVSALLAYLHIKQLDRDFAQRKEILALKQTQDGDYYLTSLLIEPLIRNSAKSALIAVDFYIEQKKKVRFYENDFDLGGDICVSDRVKLAGEDFVFFFNGDAMGKSSQGAGGALVTGSLLHSILARSHTSREMQISPERWLMAVYREIQRIMESFDGSMYVSAVFGLISEKTGALLYLNAEHPFSVLYRAGQASFTENEISVHKLGVPFAQKPKIYARQLLQGDIFLIASDGRDDLLVNGNFLDYKIADRPRFLTLVEAAQGNLKEIAAAVHGSGEVTDDLSMIRIEYKA